MRRSSAALKITYVGLCRMFHPLSLLTKKLFGLAVIVFVTKGTVCVAAA